MGRIRVGQGRSSVEISHDLEAWVRGALRRATQGVSDEVEEAAARVYRKAQARWPVDTGRSKAAMTTGLRITRRRGAEMVEGYVNTGVHYARFIRSFQKGLGGGHAITELIRRPMEVQRRALIERCREKLRGAFEARRR